MNKDSIIDLTNFKDFFGVHTNVMGILDEKKLLEEKLKKEQGNYLPTFTKGLSAEIWKHKGEKVLFVVRGHRQVVTEHRFVGPSPMGERSFEYRFVGKLQDNIAEGLTLCDFDDKKYFEPKCRILMSSMYFKTEFGVWEKMDGPMYLHKPFPQGEMFGWSIDDLVKTILFHPADQPKRDTDAYLYIGDKEVRGVMTQGEIAGLDW